MKECTQADKDFRYNFFFIGADSDFIKAAYADLGVLSNVHFHSYGLGSKNPLLRAVFKLHWSAKLNAKIRLPLKRIWFHRMCNFDFHNKKPTCYIFMEGQYIAGSEALQKYIYLLNPDNRIVIRYADLIAKKHYKDFEKVRASADLLVTYDAAEANEFHIGLYNAKIYSSLQPVTEPQDFETDVYFLGYAKDRLSFIMEVYRKLTADGVRCKFLLAGVPKEQQEQLPGIIYTKGISYRENVKNVSNARCVLEICQKGSTASTMRYSEAVTYHRLLLTNSDAQTMESYLQETMLLFHSLDDIDTKRLKTPIPYVAFKQCAFHSSPIDFLKYLEEKLSVK